MRPWHVHYDPGLPALLTPPHDTLLELFADAAWRAPEAPLIHYFGTTLSVRTIDRMSDAFAAALAERGVGHGDRVALFLQNVPQFPIAMLGIWKAGAIAVPCNPMLKTGELAKQLRDARPKAIVALESLHRAVAAEAAVDSKVGVVITTADEAFLDGARPAVVPAPQPGPAAPAEDLLALLDAHDSSAVPRPQVAPEDVAVLTYTSGTTGPAKGAMNTHRNTVYTAHVYRDWLRLTPNDVILGIAPLFHVTGLVAHLAVGLLLPAPIVLAYRFSPGETCRLIEHHGATFCLATITAYQAILADPALAVHDVSSLQIAYSGGAPIAPAFVESFEEATGISIRSAYGLTETTSPTHLTPLGRRTPVDPDTGAFSAGIPVFGTDARILDERGNVLPAGEIGEIVVKGPQVVPGYWDNPDETGRAIRDGELWTGDVGKMDEDGWLYVVDRRKDLIVASGYKVWPREVEDVLYEHRAVREAAAVGVPDAYRGESVAAFVSLVPGTSVSGEELVRFCRERLAAYKYPRTVLVLDDLPKTASGKIMRRELREGSFVP